MPPGYGKYNDNDGNEEGVGSTEFTTTWKIYLILFFKVGSDGQWPRAWAEGRGLRAEENYDQIKTID